MDQIVITGIRYEGRYDFDLEQRELTTREWGWIKRLSGYLPLTVEEGFADPELITVFAAIALRRAGRIEAGQVPAVFEELSDAPFGSAITLEADSTEVEDDADGPPASSSNGNAATSGTGSSESSEPSTETLKGSGMPASATSASDQETLVR